ncbi:hypothetical protein NEF87_005073 [Candidatus Lokiarchaeum ossiferum]|uniref:Uncharacterized protein n=1 Tax=Candidatus Lokiarchaeum ossiferum TaxID=2951803 RepID=A0ABY6HZ35_9ARCH|nr:hypothetical protein NEF87_005073 [Candidatus Lokiarchaeum sp. B-35]
MEKDEIGKNGIIFVDIIQHTLSHGLDILVSSENEI